MTDRELERLLLAAAARTTYPATPDLRGRVLARLATGERPRHALRPSFGLAMVVLVAIIAAIFALALSPSREAIARFFGVEGSKVERLPTPAPGTTATPFPAPVGLAGAKPVSLPEAAEATGFQPALPRATNALRQAYLVIYGSQPVVVLHFDQFDLWEARLEPRANFGKGVPTGVVIQDVEVGGRSGTWITGGSHVVAYISPSGEIVRGSERTVTKSTLIWRTPSLFYRLETDLSLEEAIRIAETLP